MEGTKQQVILENEIGLWKEMQNGHLRDEAFFHYSQRIIDELEYRLDLLSRFEETENECL